MELTKENIESQLKTVLDPELHVNIVDLGLIYDVKVTEKDGKPFVYVLMTLTTPGCPLAGTIHRMIKDALFVFRDQGIDVDRDVEIEITFDPPWSIECMTEEARAELGFE